MNFPAIPRTLKQGFSHILTDTKQTQTVST